METWFLVDVGLNFRFGYLDEQTMNIEMNLAAIKRRYLRGWFVLDAVSSVPLTILSLVFPSLIHGKIITTFRFFTADCSRGQTTNPNLTLGFSNSSGC
jgi:hypothetical protein